jgi:hypothetical protein
MESSVPVAKRLEVLDLHDLADYADRLGEPDWLIRNAIERQSRTIFAGAEGAGKSLLAFTGAVQAAAGVNVLANPDWHVPAPVKTLYVELEMGKRTVARRSNAMRVATKKYGAEVARDMVQVVRMDGLDPNVRRSAEAKTILDLIEQSEPDLVVFDPLYKMIPTDDTKEGGFAPLMNFLDRVRAAGATTWIIHHLRKAANDGDRGKTSSDLYGSSFLLRFPELVAFVHDDGDGRGRLVVQKDREGFFEAQGRQFFLRRGGDWPIGLMNVGEDRDKLWRDVYRALSLEGAKSASALTKDLGARKQDILGVLEQMASEGVAQRHGTGPRTSWKLGDGADVIQLFEPKPTPEPDSENPS